MSNPYTMQRERDNIFEPAINEAEDFTQYRNRGILVLWRIKRPKLRIYFSGTALLIGQAVFPRCNCVTLPFCLGSITGFPASVAHDRHVRHCCVCPSENNRSRNGLTLARGNSAPATFAKSRGAAYFVPRSRFCIALPPGAACSKIFAQPNHRHIYHVYMRSRAMLSAPARPILWETESLISQWARAWAVICRARMPKITAVWRARIDRLFMGYRTRAPRAKSGIYFKFNGCRSRGARARARATRHCAARRQLEDARGKAIGALRSTERG